MPQRPTGPKGRSASAATPESAFPAAAEPPSLTHAVWCAALTLIATAGQAQERPASAGRVPAGLHLRYEYVGFYDGGGSYSGERESCETSRRDGRLVAEGRLRLVGGEPPDNLEYEGDGRITANVDVCELKPGTGKYLGTHEYCRMTVVTTHEAALRFEVDGVDPGDLPRGARIEWERRGAVPATVTGDCEPETVAGLREQVAAGEWDTSQPIPPVAYDELLRRMAPGGVPRPGRYESPPVEGAPGRWTVTIDSAPSADDVRIAIEGPGCACLDAEDPAPEVLDFAARASVRGGTFGRWSVAPEGQPPQELRNTGGAVAGLSLSLTGGTHRVTLSVSYTRDGKTYRSEPYPVTVCITDSISTPDGVKDIAFDDRDPGRAVVRASTRARVAGKDVSGQVAWKLEAMNDGTSLAPEDATGAQAEFTYTKLPGSNRSFGKKALTARIDTDGCACERSAFVRVFFAPFAANHPQPSPPPAGSDTPTPNWFYYWMQSSAARGVDPARVAFRRTIAPENLPPRGAPPPVVNGRYDEGTDRVLIAERVPRSGACRARMARRAPPAAATATAVSAAGLDCFAETLKHEWQHRIEYRQWWPGGYDRASDLDGDRVPNAVEEQAPGCSPVNPLSCRDRPFPDATDRELSAYWVGWTWPIGSATEEDWTCHGKQWRGKVCPLPSVLPP